MAEDKKTTMKEEKREHSEAEKTHEHKHEEHAHTGHEHKHEEKAEKKEVKDETKKDAVREKPKVKKESAAVRAPGIHISKRHGMYICSFIKGKDIDKALSELHEVILLKRAIPFKGEIPHRKGKMMSGRYPVAAAKLFIPLLKNLKGAVLFNGMDLAKTRISSAYTNFAPRPQRRGGTKGKRASVTIEAREVGK